MCIRDSFIGGLLDSDVRNNSAWNQRWFVLVRGKEGAGSDSTLISDDVVRKELQYCFSKFDIVKNNQAAWAYLEGLMDSRQYSNFPEIERYIRENVLSSSSVGLRRLRLARPPWLLLVHSRAAVSIVVVFSVHP